MLYKKSARQDISIPAEKVIVRTIFLFFHTSDVSCDIGTIPGDDLSTVSGKTPVSHEDFWNIHCMQKIVRNQKHS